MGRKKGQKKRRTQSKDERQKDKRRKDTRQKDRWSKGQKIKRTRGQKEKQAGGQRDKAYMYRRITLRVSVASWRPHRAASVGRSFCRSCRFVDYGNIKFGGLILEEHARIVCCASRTKCCTPMGARIPMNKALWDVNREVNLYNISRRRMPIVMNIGGIDEQGRDEANGHGRKD